MFSRNIHEVRKGQETHSNLPITLHNADLDILGTRLYDLQKTLDGEFDALFACEVVFVVLFEEFADGF